MPGADLSPDTVEAAKNLDAVIGNLCKNFSDSVDYFKILVDVFRNELSTNKNTHLANFYMIIPALTVNFVEQILQSKVRRSK
jgi:WASH complex subunit 7